MQGGQAFVRSSRFGGSSPAALVPLSGDSLTSERDLQENEVGGRLLSAGMGQRLSWGGAIGPWCFGPSWGSMDGAFYTIQLVQSTIPLILSRRHTCRLCCLWMMEI